MAKNQRADLVAVAVGSIGIALIVLGVQTMLRAPDLKPYRDVPGGDVERGRKALARYQCGSCHTIPGVAGANGTRGQPLVGLALRNDIVGALPNTPDDVARWIRNPKAIYPQTTMPTLDVSQSDALDMVAYLYALRP